MEYYLFNSDFADEVVEKESENEFYKFSKSFYKKIGISKVEILKYHKSIGKEIGDYVSIDINDLDDYKERVDVSNILADTLKEMITKFNLKSNFHTLIVGLGNDEVTADSLGPLSASQVLITNHLFIHEKENIKKGTGRVSMITPGVMGQTGLETYDIIYGISKEIKPDLIIAIDSLASRSLQRINRVIQITNSGIRPGSGVGNRRKALTKASLKVPVIAIGVATVVDIINVLLETLEKIEKKGNVVLDVKDRKEIIGSLTEDKRYNMIVTPKEIDQDISTLSSVIAMGINKAIHKNLKDL